MQDLGTHMAGLARESPCAFCNCNRTITEICKSLESEYLVYPVGSQLSYSNLGFALLGRGLESVLSDPRASSTGTPQTTRPTTTGPMPHRHNIATFTTLTISLLSPPFYILLYTGTTLCGCIAVSGAKTWEDFIEQDIFKPLGMRRSSARGTAPPGSTVAAAYTPSGADMPVCDIGFEAPAGQIWASAGDMGRFLGLLSLRSKAAGSTPDQLLGGATINRWLQERAVTNPTMVAEGYVLNTAWGMPWEVQTAVVPGSKNFTRFDVLTKTGRLPGYTTLALYQPGLDIAMIAFAADGQHFQEGLFDQLASVEFGLGIVPAMQNILQSLQPTPSVPQASVYTGTYSLTAQGQTVNLTISAGPSAGNRPGTWLKVEAPLLFGPTAYDLQAVHRSGASGPYPVWHMLASASDMCLVTQNGELFDMEFGDSGAADDVYQTVSVRGLGVQVAPLVFTRASL